MHFYALDVTERLLSLALGAIVATTSLAAGQRDPPRLLPVEGDVSPVHDPVLIRQGGTYHLFARWNLGIEGGRTWKGPGNPAVLLAPKGDLLVFHAYDDATGRPRLHISTMVWEGGWPRAARLD